MRRLLPDPKTMSSRSARVGFACNAQAANMAESVTCDVADWESLVSMRWYLRHLNLLDTSKGINISEMAFRKDKDV